MSTRRAVHSVIATIAVLSGMLAGGLPAAGATLTSQQPAISDRSNSCGGLVAYNAMTGSPDTSRLTAIPATGGTPRVVWDRLGQGELDPAWSPDGRSIAFVGRTPPTPSPAGYNVADSRLYVLRSGESEPQILVEHFAQRGGLRFPAWSPDGQRIAYASGVQPDGADYRGLAWVHLIDVKTGSDRLLTVMPGVPDVHMNLFTLSLDWSPRGDQLLITSRDAVYNWSIFSINPSAAVPQLAKLTHDNAPAMAYPAFFPGGRAVLVEQDSSDFLTSRLKLADTRLRHLVPVGTATGWDTQPDFGWSPLQATYQHYNADRTETSIAILTLPTGTSHEIVPHADRTVVEEPDWQPVIGCHPWPFAT